VVLRGQLVSVDLKVLRVHQVFQVYLALQVRAVLKDRKALQVRKVQRELVLMCPFLVLSPTVF
jgi:hypothetical protein